MRSLRVSPSRLLGKLSRSIINYLRQRITNNDGLSIALRYQCQAMSQWNSLIYLKFGLVIKLSGGTIVVCFGNWVENMDLNRSLGEYLTSSVLTRARLTTWISIPLLVFCCVIYSTAVIAKSPKVPLITVAKAQSQAVIKQVPLTGTVTSPKVSRISAEVSGHVKTFNVDIGDRVNKGDVLLRLDREMEALTLKAYQAATLQATEELSEARRRYESGKRLREQNSISKEESDQRHAQVKILEAALQRQQAEEQKQQVVVKNHTIRAPFSGVVSEKLTEVGEWIDTGKPVLTLIAMDQLRIDFQAPQELFTQVNNNSSLTISLDALKDKKFSASVDAIVPVSDPDARTFLIRAKIKENDINMTPGMSAQGLLQLETGNDGVVVSRDAIIRYRDGRITVWVVKKQSDTATVEERHVKLGHGFDGKVSVVSGLKVNEVVVIQGNESLKDGQTVRIHNTP